MSEPQPAPALGLISRFRRIIPGLLTAIIIALAAGFIADHYGGPTLLYALLFGMALHHLSADERCQPGISFAARPVLRLGVALLGARITLEQILALGPRPLIIVLIGVPLTIGCGLLLARALGLGRSLGMLTGGAVAICGASAAMAIAAVLPQHADSERHLVFTVIGVTTLSTVAMILYPMVVRLAGLDDVTAGIYLGGTIHDVAQVVGAGYLLGETAGQTATFTKLLRVAMLVPTVLVISLVLSRRVEPGGKRAPLLPGFLVAFLVLVGINSAGWVPAVAQTTLADISRWCLVTAIAAIGLKGSLAELAQLGWRPLLLMIGETLLLAALGLVVLM